MRSIGPYGGSKESETKRPIVQAFTAIAIVFIMMLILLVLLLMVGDYLGPVMLIIVTFIERWPRMPGQEMNKVNKTILNALYAVAVGLTVLVVYIGGSPITYYPVAGGGQLAMVHPWGQTFVPLWVETLRMTFVVTSAVSEFILILLLSRVLTEMLFPSLPNSFVALRGQAPDGIVPIMKIKDSRQGDEGLEDEGVIPEDDGVAPRRGYL